MSRLSLNLVSGDDELRGQGPPAFERLARATVVGDKGHIGLLSICVALTHACIKACLPPSAQKQVLAPFNEATTWLHRKSSPTQVKSARIQCFQMVSPIEELTVKAVQKAQAHLGARQSTPLDPHADHVVSRYARLAAHFSVSAACHTLDAIETPALALEVLQDVQGARAYQGVGLGAARHAAFRQAAWDQATWEAAQMKNMGQHPETTSSIALQVFHEYLGGRYQSHTNAERAQTNQFIDWALTGA